MALARKPLQRRNAVGRSWGVIQMMVTVTAQVQERLPGRLKRRGAQAGTGFPCWSAQTDALQQKRSKPRSSPLNTPALTPIHLRNLTVSVRMASRPTGFERPLTDSKLSDGDLPRVASAARQAALPGAGLRAACSALRRARTACNGAACMSVPGMHRTAVHLHVTSGSTAAGQQLVRVKLQSAAQPPSAWN